VDREQRVDQDDRYADDHPTPGIERQSRTVESLPVKANHEPLGGHSGTAVALERAEEVPLQQLRFGLSPRFTDPDPDHVAVLAGVMPQLPPVVVHAESMRVIDGVHRVLAARSLGHKTIKVVLFSGEDSDASIQAILYNIAHGKPLTLAERKAGAEKIVNAHPEWSDRRIAALCGLSPKTIPRLRQDATVESRPFRRRLGKDGKLHSTNPAEMRHRIAAAWEANPTASIRAIAAQTGAAQGTVRDVRARLQRGDDILSPRLAEARRRQEQSSQAALTDDQALLSQQDSAAFVNWFDNQRLTEDADWMPFVDCVPISRVYEVADAARRCAQCWQRFATEVENRIRR
jgi:ParB-like chromosome segregation protein Spo0J